MELATVVVSAQEGELVLVVALELAVEAELGWELGSELEMDHCTLPGSPRHKLQMYRLGKDRCNYSATLQDIRAPSGGRCPDWLPLASTKLSCSSW